MCRDAERDDRELEKREDIVAMLGRRGDNDKLRKAENGRGRMPFGEMAEMTDRHREREGVERMYVCPHSYGPTASTNTIYSHKCVKNED